MPKNTKRTPAIPSPVNRLSRDSTLLRVFREEGKKLQKYADNLHATTSIPLEVINEHCSKLALVSATLRLRENHPDVLHDLTAKVAMAGETEAARYVLADFVEASKNAPGKDTVVPGLHARFIADAFSRILQGEDPARALGLKHRRTGRPKGRVTHNQTRLAAAYTMLVRSGLTAKRARNEIQTISGADEKTVRGAIEAKPNFAFPVLIDDDALRVFAGPMAEKIGPILARRSKR